MNYQNDALTNAIICTVGIVDATARQNDDPRKIRRLHVTQAIANAVQKMEHVPTLSVSLQDGYMLVYGEVLDTVGEEYLVTLKLNVPDAGTISDTFCITGATVNGHFLCRTQLIKLNQLMNNNCAEKQTTAAGHDGWEGSFAELDDTEIDPPYYG
ncbi:MAG: hypothetical protein AAFR81_25305 [Chloroflexota bacterium]